MDIKRHLKAALKQLGFDKPRKAQIIPMKTLDAGQDAIVIAATGSGKQVIYETVGLAHSDKLTIVIEPLLALIYNQVQTLQAHDISAEYIDKDTTKEDTEKLLKKARKGKLNFLYVTPERLQNSTFSLAVNAVVKAHAVLVAALRNAAVCHAPHLCGLTIPRNFAAVNGCKLLQRKIVISEKL